MTEYLYRYVDATRSIYSDEEDTFPAYSITNIYCNEYEIIKRTPKGAWIKRPFEKDKFILLTAKKQWASDTKQEALNQLIYRKRYYLRILNKKVVQASTAVTLALRELEKLK